MNLLSQQFATAAYLGRHLALQHVADIGCTITAWAIAHQDDLDTAWTDYLETTP